MKKYGLYFAWIVSIVASVGSIFLGEFRHQEPCVLCWYQRVFMFPLVIILGIASFRNAAQIILYTLPLPLLGLIIALYQIVTIQLFPNIAICTVCKISELPHHTYFIPLLSSIAFGLISFFLIWTGLLNRRSK